MNWFTKLFKKEEDWKLKPNKISIDNELKDLIDNKLDPYSIDVIVYDDVLKNGIRYIQTVKEGNSPCFNTGWKCNNLTITDYWVTLHPYCQKCCWQKWCK